MNPRFLKMATHVTLGLGALFTAVALAHDGAGGVSLFTELALWTLLPFALVLVAVVFAHSRGRALAVLVTALVCSASAFLYYGQAAFTHRTYLSGVVFALLPTYQVIPAAILLVILFFTRHSNANRNA
jgi:hypothetical protein